MRLATFALLLLATPATFSQVMYRCGNTFSQQPCGADAKQMDVPGAAKVPPPVPVPADTPASPEVIDNAKALCQQRVTAMLKDPDSVKFVSVERAQLRRTGANIVVRDYALLVNAKNSFGGYTGAKRWTCSLDHKSETSIVWAGPVE